MEMFPSLRYGEPDTVTEDSEDNVSEIRMGDGYTQVGLLGINPRRRVLTLSWTRSDARELYDWIKARKVNTPFLFKIYGDTVESVWRCSACTAEYKERKLTTVNATFKEDFTP